MTFHIYGCKHDTIVLLLPILKIVEVMGIKYVEINCYVTSTVYLETQGHSHLLYDVAQLQLIICDKLDLGVDFNSFHVADFRNSKINFLKEKFDLKNKLLFDLLYLWFKHSSNMIFVSILTFLRPGIS